VKLAPASRRCFQRIAVGLDDSEPAAAAVNVVLGFPPEDRLELIFYSIVDGQKIDARRESSPAEGDGAYAHALHVVKNVELARSRGVTARGHVSVGKAYEALIAASKGKVHEGKGAAHLPSRVVESAADLMVLGSHGKGGAKRHFLGSVVESVVRSAPLPVLVIRGPAGSAGLAL
jgi:nucleotide-binding universal stress UspA family protein